MAYVAIADRDHALHDPQTFITKYIWSKDNKVIAIKNAITAIGIGLVALGMSVLMRLQLGFPHFFSIIAPNNYYQFITFFFQAEDGIRDYKVTGVQTCALPI